MNSAHCVMLMWWWCMQESAGASAEFVHELIKQHLLQTARPEV